jgi:hypothetical protein
MTKRLFATGSNIPFTAGYMICELDTSVISVDWLLVDAADIGAEFNFQVHG